MEYSKLSGNNLNIKKDFLLDPLSVIIKLAILGNKRVGTKLLLKNNIIYFQKPGLFQSVSRIFYNISKNDLQYLYYPIKIACTTFLSRTNIEKIPRIKNLFKFAQIGLIQLMETYKNSYILSYLKYYYIIIKNFVEEKHINSDFYKKSLINVYTKKIFDNSNNECIINTLNEQWGPEKINIILDLFTQYMSLNNIKITENIMETIDLNSKNIIQRLNVL